MRTPSQNNLLFLILLAILLGGLFGGLFPQQALHTKFLGEIFLNALKMVVVPLVVASMIVGVTNLGDIRRIGGIGRRTVIYYMATTGMSVLLGLLLVNIIRPGVGLHHGENLTSEPYTIQGQTVSLRGEGIGDAGYDGRYQVVLKDQGVSGIIDPGATRTRTQLTVSEWLDIDTGQRVRPDASGTGLSIDLAVAQRVKGKDRSIIDVLTDVLVGMVPTNVFKAMVETDVLPLIVFSLLFGGVLTTLGERADPLIQVITSINEAIMKVVHIVITFAPVGIFGLIAARMGASGGWAGFYPELVKLGWYATTVVLGLLGHGLVILPLVLLIVARRNVLEYGRNLLTALSTAFSTASSSATLPLTIECVQERNGISNRTASFVLPLGATIRETCPATRRIGTRSMAARKVFVAAARSCSHSAT